MRMDFQIDKENHYSYVGKCFGDMIFTSPNELKTAAKSVFDLYKKDYIGLFLSFESDYSGIHIKINGKIKPKNQTNGTPHN